ncbi:MAG: hypothetical protein C4K58_04655 [Flavobacteriaceae bacterium]|nr:MAG: hypothetical protein C4K58_04655 [Flavobacteriaceae bacterium]
MKKTHTSLFLLAATIFCSFKLSTGNSQEITPTKGQTIAQTSYKIPSQCAMCHSETKKMVGPSFTEIAKKYDLNKAANVEYLKDKITNGSKGTWGKGAMPKQKMDEKALNEFIGYLKTLRAK